MGYVPPGQARLQHAAVWPLVRIFPFTISVSTRTDIRGARQTEAADPTENQRHAC